MRYLANSKFQVNYIMSDQSVDWSDVLVKTVLIFTDTRGRVVQYFIQWS